MLHGVKRSSELLHASERNFALQLLPQSSSQQMAISKANLWKPSKQESTFTSNEHVDQHSHVPRGAPRIILANAGDGAKDTPQHHKQED